MSSLFPTSIQSFPVMEDMTTSDATMVTQFQQAMQTGNLSLAQTILKQITDYDKKIISSELMNVAWDTLVALQRYFATRYSSAYVISETEPEGQEPGDYWFEVIKTDEN